MDGMNELASTHAKLAIEALLSVYALTNMHRASGNDTYRKTALKWFKKIEEHIAAAKADLEQK